MTDRRLDFATRVAQLAEETKEPNWDLEGAPAIPMSE